MHGSPSWLISRWWIYSHRSLLWLFSGSHFFSCAGVCVFISIRFVRFMCVFVCVSACSKSEIKSLHHILSTLVHLLVFCSFSLSPILLAKLLLSPSSSLHLISLVCTSSSLHRMQCDRFHFSVPKLLLILLSSKPSNLLIAICSSSSSNFISRFIHRFLCKRLFLMNLFVQLISLLTSCTDRQIHSVLTQCAAKKSAFI